MPAAVSSPRLEAAPSGGWWVARWASPLIAAGITDRRSAVPQLVGAVRGPVTVVAAEQVHGGSVAVVGSTRAGELLAGADALVTDVPGVALAIRTADCLPIFFADPGRRVVGLAHAGWRGIAAGLPARVVTAMRRSFQSRARELHAAIGPSIRSCCYEVGEEFNARFGPHVQERQGRRTCDLIEAAMAQLTACGMRPERIVDTQACTACDTQRWFSLRREGPTTGRLTSLILLRPRARGR